MWAKRIMVCLCCLWLAWPAAAQSPGESVAGGLRWRSADGAAAPTTQPQATRTADLRTTPVRQTNAADDIGSRSRSAPVAKPSRSDGALAERTRPGLARAISHPIPYVLRAPNVRSRALVDWILRETGYEAWHGEPLGILSATPRTLRVYHTPEMQQVVSDLVDRFVMSEAETWQFSVRVITLDHPGWRMRVERLMQPVTVQTPGVGAWLLKREDAAIFVAELQRRSDYREHTSPLLQVNNGQATVISAMRSRPYVRDILLKPEVWQGFEPQSGAVDEGFAIEFSPLLSTDRQFIDAVIKCSIDQVEKMHSVELEAPTTAAPRQRTPIEVPQTVQFRFHERFRWPVGQALLVGMGMVPLPVPVDAKAVQIVPGIPLPLPKSPPRAELLLLIEAKGAASAHTAQSVPVTGRL